MARKLSYKSSGVDYSKMDPVKILAQKAAAKTANNLKITGAKELIASRGESAYVWEEQDCYRALVVEGLGTKNLVADETRKFTGKTYYDILAQDTVAMIVNDLIVVGALPQVVNAYFAIGDSNWLADKRRAMDLITGWAKACDDCGATWGGGETPTLTGVINSDTIDLGGSAVGIIKPKTHLVLGEKLKIGDAILLIESNGIHANGITLARKIAANLPGGFSTKLKDGTTFGEAILKPTHLYATLVRQLQRAQLDIHYMVNITGHGWRKLMRPNQEFSYVIEKLPPAQEIFDFIATHSGNDATEMYGNYNMGVGFAVYLPQEHVKEAQVIARRCGFRSWLAGHIAKGPKQVVIQPKNITFEAETLSVR